MTGVSTSTRAAVARGHGEYDIEDLAVTWPDRGAVFEVEAAGICGSDLPKFFGALAAPVVLGHETVGRVVDGDTHTLAVWGVDPTTRYLIEEYVPCGACRSCLTGRHRACAQTNSRDPNALRYGTTPVTRAPGVWGGFSQRQYLHPRTVLHRLPDGLDPRAATFALPLSNGVQWMLTDVDVRVGESVLVQGPGQQGLACALAAKAAGAGPVVVAGLSADRPRLDQARSLGIDAVVDVEEQDLASEVRRLVGSDGVDVVADTTGAGAPTVRTGIDLVRRGGRVALAAVDTAEPLQGLEDLLSKEVTLRGVRGHGYEAVEVALRWLGEGTVDAHALGGQVYPLERLDEAFTALQSKETVHAVVEPCD